MPFVPRLVATGFLLLCSHGSLLAQALQSLSQSQAMRQVYAPVVQRAVRSVVEIAIAGEQRILGTVVAPDLIVTKLSELIEPSVDGPPWTCRQGELTWSCTRLAFDRAADLALLRVTAEPSQPLTPIEWQSAPPLPGAFLATPGTGPVPLGIGILAAAPYEHTPQRAFLGVRFADPAGRAELAETIEHGAAAAAGLLPGDVVVRFAAKPIAKAAELQAQLRNQKPGEKVQVTVRRGDAEQSFEVTLGTNSSAMRSPQENVWGPLSTVRSGFREVLQHDTVLTPADCGGPIVDLAGKAIGVNIARAGRVETLALPAAAVQQIVAELLKSVAPGGKPTTGK